LKYNITEKIRRNKEMHCWCHCLLSPKMGPCHCRKTNSRPVVCL